MAEMDNPSEEEARFAEEGAMDEMEGTGEDNASNQGGEALAEADHLGDQLGDESSVGDDGMGDDAGIEEALQAWEEGGHDLEEIEDADQITAVRFAQLEGGVPKVDKRPNILDNIIVDLRVELGRKEMTVSELTELKEQEVIELDKLAGEPFDVRVNGRLFATGEVVVVTDLMAVRITSLNPNPDTQRTETE